MEENIANKMVCPRCKSPNIEYADGTYRCQDCRCEWRLSDEVSPKAKSLTIRNSTMEFLIIQTEGTEQGVEVFYRDENFWATQKAMSLLFDVGIPDISKHLKNIYETGELKKETTVSKMEIVVKRGFRGEVPEQIDFYSLDAIIAVAYRVKSIRATQFRQWATAVLRQFAIRGYVLDKKRMENGAFLGEDYFEHLLAEIREIRLSERRFYQKLTDIYATSIDYNPDAPTTRMFFRTVQNKIHFAVHGRTADELIAERADAHKEHMGLITWENAPDGKIVKTDVSIAKNYLKQVELEDMGRIVTAVLEFAESRAKRHITMTMEDWARRIDAYLSSDERPLLDNVGCVSHEEAVLHAETEFEKFRIIQDRLYRSDFDRYLSDLTFIEGPEE